MAIHKTSSNDTVSLSLFKLVSFGTCVFINTSHTHSYHRYFFSKHQFNGCHFIHQVCAWWRQTRKKIKWWQTVHLMEIGKEIFILQQQQQKRQTSRWKWCVHTFASFSLYFFTSWYCLVCWFCNKIKWMCSVAKCKMICHPTSREMVHADYRPFICDGDREREREWTKLSNDKS